MSPKITPLDKHIAKRIKAVRLKRDVTQPTVAGVLGVSYQSYQKMERGAVSFRASTLERLAAALGVPMSYFFGDGPPPALENGAEIGSIVSILGSISTDDAKSVVEFAARVKGGQRPAVQA